MLLESVLLTSLCAPAAGVVEGLPAPEISAKEWINTRPTSLAKEAGKVVVLEFWATW